MKAGTFNINDYLERLTEEAATNAEKKPDSEGLIIPDTNQKAYKWLQGEYSKAQTEVKVEMKIGNEKFNPGYEMQTNLKSVKDFKPGMFGQAQEKDAVSALKTNNFGGKETKQEKPNAEAKPEENLPKPAEQKTEGKPEEEKTVSGIAKKTTPVVKAAKPVVGQVVGQKKPENPAPATAPKKFQVKKAEIK